MTKTQALQRLYKALTGNEGRNTGSKVIEDLAVAAENGEIGGGGKMATVQFTMSDASPADVRVSVCCLNHAGIVQPYVEAALLMVGMQMFVPVAGLGTLLSVITDDTVTATGSVESSDIGYIVTGDCNFTISNPK